jgi:hypothetical protein
MMDDELGKTEALEEVRRVVIAGKWGHRSEGILSAKPVFGHLGRHPRTLGLERWRLFAGSANACRGTTAAVDSGSEST